MTRHIFCEPEIGHVRHTAASALFVTEPDFTNWIGHNLMETLPAVANVSKAIDKYGSSTEATHSAFNVAFNNTTHPMAFIATGDISGPRFASGMNWIGKNGTFDNSHIVDNYPWGELGSATIVDVSLPILHYLYFTSNLLGRRWDWPHVSKHS